MQVNGLGKSHKTDEHLPDDLVASLDNRRVVVSGGAGAIGSNLVRVLIRCGCRVVVIDDFSSGWRQNLQAVEGEVDLIEGDLADGEVLRRAFIKPVDYVFHLAAFFANQNSVDHPQDDLHTNGLATLRLFECAAAKKVRRLVFASSSCVYGSHSESFDETMRMEPETPYAMTKVLGEQYAGFYHSQGGLSTATLRYFNSFGPGEFPGKYRNVIPNFFALALRGEPLLITGTGEETRDFTFVEDIVRGTILAALVPAADGEIFNLGTGEAAAIGTLAEEINAIVGNVGGIIYKDRRDWDHILHRKADIEKARRVLAYRPQVNLQEGLERYWKWYAEQNKHAELT